LLTYSVDDIQSLYHVIIGKEEHTTSKETNQAIVIPEDLVHQHTFPPYSSSIVAHL